MGPTNVFQYIHVRWNTEDDNNFEVHIEHFTSCTYCDMHCAEYIFSHFHE